MTPRVLLVARPGIGGAARVIEALLRRLPERGVRGTAALSSLEGTDLLDAAAEHGWDVVRLDLRREIAPLADLAAFRRLRRLGRGHDLVHAHAAKAGALARVALGKRLPVVYAPHGFYFTYHPEGSAPHRRYLTLESRLAPLTSVLHCVSEAEATTARRYGLAAADRALVVPNPVPPRNTQRDPNETLQALGIPPASSVVLMAARLTEPKDPATFVRAAGHAPGDARFILAGDGPLLAAARDADARRVVFAGVQEDVQGLLTRTRVAVLASASEALPVFLVEAMAAGVPVVATDLPGCREACGDGALYVPPGDPAALGAAVGRIITDAALHARLAARAHAQAVRYDEDRWLDAIVALYASATNARSTS